MKFWRIIGIFLLFSGFAFGQGSIGTGWPVVTNSLGQPIPGATVAVCNANPGSPTSGGCPGHLVTTYTDITDSTACSGTSQPLNNSGSPTVGSGCSNPGTVDGLGNVIVYASAGQYWCEEYGTPIVGVTVTPCIFPLTSAGNVNWSGAQTFSGPLTGSGDNPLNWAGPITATSDKSGNVAIKNASSDSIRYVTSAGNDANDGLSWGAAKATISSAYSSLPTCTPDPSYNYGNATFAFSAPCGTIYIGGHATSASDGYTIASTVTINSAMVRIAGPDKLGTQIQCGGSTSPCLQFNMGNSAGAGHGGGTITAGPSPVMSARGGLENLTIVGSSTAGQTGVLCNDCTGAVFKDVRITGFTGANANALNFNNDLDGITERLDLEDVALDGNTNDILLSAPNASLLSFNHNYFHNLQFTVGPSQTAWTMTGFAQWSGYVDGTVNICGAGTSCTGFNLQNSAQFKGFDGLLYDGAGTLTLCSGCTQANFQAWGAGAGATQGSTNSGNLNIKDQILNFNSTGSNFVGATFQNNGVTEWNFGSDASNDPCIWNATANTRWFCTLNGGGGLYLFGTGGVTTLNVSASSSPTLAAPSLTGNLAVTANSTSGLIQTKRAVAGCTTAASIGGVCATDVTVTWGTAFADTNYAASCTGMTPTNVPSGPYIVSKAAGSMHVNYFAITAAAASYSTLDCIAQHD